MMLIIAGGIGFLTWEDIKNHKWHFKKIPDAKQGDFYGNRNIDILTGSFTFFILSFQMCLLQKEYGVSLFQSVTPRTAGFNTAEFDFTQ